MGLGPWPADVQNVFSGAPPIGGVRLAIPASIDDRGRVIVFKVLAIISLLASATSAIAGVRIAYSRDPKARRLYTSLHISSGIVLCVTAAMLAFWAFTEPGK
jgi:hypothetical protein